MGEALATLAIDVATEDNMIRTGDDAIHAEEGLTSVCLEACTDRYSAESFWNVARLGTRFRHRSKKAPAAATQGPEREAAAYSRHYVAITQRTRLRPDGRGTFDHKECPEAGWHAGQAESEDEAGAGNKRKGPGTVLLKC